MNTWTSYHSSVALESMEISDTDKTPPPLYTRCVLFPYSPWGHPDSVPFPARAGETLRTGKLWGLYARTPLSQGILPELQTLPSGGGHSSLCCHYLTLGPFAPSQQPPRGGP